MDKKLHPKASPGEGPVVFHNGRRFAVRQIAWSLQRPTIVKQDFVLFTMVHIVWTECGGGLADGCACVFDGGAMQ